MRYLYVLCFVVLSSLSYGQDHFMVEFEAFTPPVKDMIRSFEGQPAEPFLASDLNGTEHYLGNYKGKKVILWFWSTTSTKAQEQMSAMSLLQQRNDDLKIIAFAKEPKAAVEDYLRTYPMDLPVIPNGEVFGQMAYGADLGSPRMFLIDTYGIIHKVLPEEAFVDNTKLLVDLEAELSKLR